MSLGTSILECSRRRMPQPELECRSVATRNGQTARVVFDHSSGYGVYFARVGAGPKWRVEVYENDDDPEIRCFVFGRTANRATNAIRLVAAWRVR